MTAKRRKRECERLRAETEGLRSRNLERRHKRDKVWNGGYGKRSCVRPAGTRQVLLSPTLCMGYSFGCHMNGLDVKGPLPNK